VGENAGPAKSQDLARPFGRLLHFNGDGTIPDDNLFCITGGQLKRAVWAYGQRILPRSPCGAAPRRPTGIPSKDSPD
jgi:glucose/arabinose dehydrogenase